jgi:membrane protease YdiL (CAAX protease family)
VLEEWENKDRKLSLGWIWVAWLALGFTVFGFVIFGFIAQGDPVPVIERLFGDTGCFAFLVYTVGQGIAAIVLVLLVKRRGLNLRILGFRGSLTIQMVLYAVGGWFVAFWLYYIVEKLLGIAGIRMFWNESDYLALDSPSRIVIVVIATLVVAPLAEELIYRGYVLQALLDRMRAPVAAVLSALVFSSIHLGIGLGLAVYIFLGGLILAYLYMKFQNVYACVLMHLLNNIVAYIVIPLVVLS